MFLCSCVAPFLARGARRLTQKVHQMAPDCKTTEREREGGPGPRPAMLSRRRTGADDWLFQIRETTDGQALRAREMMRSALWSQYRPRCRYLPACAVYGVGRHSMAYDRLEHVACASAEQKGQSGKIDRAAAAARCNVRLCTERPANAPSLGRTCQFSKPPLPVSPLVLFPPPSVS